MAKETELKLFNYSYATSETADNMACEGPYLQVQILHMIKAGIIRADATILDESEEYQYPLSYFLDQDTAVTDIKLNRIDVGFGNAVEVCLVWTLAAIPATILASLFIFIIIFIFGGVMARVLGGI